MDKNLEKLREQVRFQSNKDNTVRKVALKKVEDQLEKILVGFGDSDKTMITFEQLKMFEIGVRNEVVDGVSFEKTFESESKIVFLTFMLDGGSFGVHSHDCLEECRVLKGNLVERTRGYKIYEEGETLFYAKDEIHRPYATKESLYEVIFYKNK